MRIGIITNLNSRKNRAKTDRASHLAGLLGPDGVVRETRDISEIRPVLEEFLDLGLDYWVADGGDGTFHWMLNEGRDALEATGRWAGDHPFPKLVPTNGGTIDFVARKARIKGKADDVIAALVAAVRSGREPSVVEVDAVELSGQRPGEQGTSFRRLGFAVALGGIGQKFFKKFYDLPERGADDILKVILKSAIGYAATVHPFSHLPFPEDWREHGRWLMSGTRASVKADGREFGYGVFQGLHAGSIEIELGPIRLFPYAAPGKLHIAVGAARPIDCTWLWAFLLLGRPIPGGRWHEFAGHTLDVTASAGERLDPVIDGEIFEGFDRLQLGVGPKVLIPTL